MLTTKHLEDYILKKDNETPTVELGAVRGHRRLNEELLAKQYTSLNLNEGYEQWSEDESASSGKLDVLLKWMIKKSPEGKIDEVLNGAKFVSRRGALSRMAQGEYLGSKGDWQVMCVRRRGVIYLEEEKTPVEMKMATASCQERIGMYWGHRFEDLMLRDPPAPKTSETPMDSKADTRVVMKATLTGRSGTVKLLYSGEVDAVDSAGKFVQVKTAKYNERGFGYWFWKEKRPTWAKWMLFTLVRHTKSNERGPGYWFWKEKSLKWWLQSRLVDVDYLAVGLRDSEGIVHRLTTMTMMELERGSQYWHPSDCFNFLLKALLYIDENLDEGEAARVTCTAGQLEVEELRPKDAPILTEEFIDHFDL